MGIGQAFNLVGGAVSDLFAASGYKSKAQGHMLASQGHLLGARANRMRREGQEMEADLYDESALFTRQNERIARNSTEIKLLQEDRKIMRTMGGQAADVAASGFASSGSALDILRASAAEGALTKQVLGQQGLIEETALEHQAESYDVMARASRLSGEMSELAAQKEELAAQGEVVAANAANKAATGSKITAGLKIAGAVFSLFDVGKLFTGGGGDAGGGGGEA